MTGRASADDVCVIDCVDRSPDITRVAVFANVTGLNMRQRLSCGLSTVMAAEAVTGNIDMIEVRR